MLKKIKKNKLYKYLIFLLILIVIIKFIFLTFSNTFLDFVKSNKFHDFLMNRIEYHLIKLSEEIENGKKQSLIQALKKIDSALNKK